jgi:hypothetical protein
MTPGFYIPYWIAERRDISPLAKILYGVFSAFQSFENEGVWASRKFLATRIACSQQRITQMVKELKDADLVFFNGEKTLENGNKIRLIKRTSQDPLIISYYGGYKDIISPPNKKLLPSNNIGVNNIREIYPSKNGMYGSVIRFFKEKNKLSSSIRKYARLAVDIQKEQKQTYPRQFNQYSEEQLFKQLINGTEVVDQLVRIDGWDFSKEVAPAINWAIKDDFWAMQVYSLAQLRSKSKSNGQTKFTNIFNGWKMEDKIKSKKAKQKDERNPGRQELRKGPDGKMRWTWV